MDGMVDSVNQAGSDPATNPYQIAREMGDEMTAACTVVKTHDRLLACIDKIRELRERFSRVRLADDAIWTNQSLSFTRATGDMLILAELIALASLERKESRGSHYRLDHPDRDDANFLRTTIGEYDPASGEHRILWRDVDTSLVKPRARTYGKVESASNTKQVAAAAAQ